MKQHISIDQLNELSEKGNEKLREWWKPEEGDFFKRNISAEYSGELLYGCDGSDPESGDTPLLSIGQMIEFLGEKTKAITVLPLIELCIQGNKPLRNLDIENFCDALWEAVKTVLEKP